MSIKNNLSINTERGFTLIEVMVSLFILLAGMAGVIKLQATSAVITKLSGDLTYAQNLAQTTLQRQLSRQVNEVLSSGQCLFESGLADSKEYNNKRIKYKVTCSVDNNISAMLGSKKIGTSYSPAAFIKVKVEWKDLLKNGDYSSHTVYSYGIVTNK